MVEISAGSQTELFQITKLECDKENGGELFSKCGEIFFERLHEELVFFCFHCDKKLRSIALFINHLNQEHDLSLQNENMELKALHQDSLDDSIIDDEYIEEFDFADKKPNLESLNGDLKSNANYDDGKDISESWNEEENFDSIDFENDSLVKHDDYNDDDDDDSIIQESNTDSYGFPLDNNEESIICETDNYAEQSDEASTLENPPDEDVQIQTMFCIYCFKSFDDPEDRKKHNCRKHTKKVYECEICKKVFYQRGKLKTHMNSHLKIKPYPCDICGVAFRDKSNLIVHKKRHANEKPYKCEYCEKCFVTSSERTSHERCHTGECNFVCEICGVAYSSASKLGIHRRRHLNIKNYKCEKCGKAFLTSQSLKFHYASHDNVRSHKCEFCSSAFKTVKTLRQHNKLHQAKKYMCKICLKPFAQQPGLYSHMKMHSLITEIE